MEKISKKEWLDRFANRMMAVLGITKGLAIETGRISYTKEESPEDAADFEISYWREG